MGDLVYNGACGLSPKQTLPINNAVLFDRRDGSLNVDKRWTAHPFRGFLSAIERS